MILDKEAHIRAYNMRCQLSALGMEMIGMNFGRSVCAHIKREYGITKRLKKDVYKEFHTMIVQKEKEMGLPERELTKTEKQHLGV